MKAEIELQADELLKCGIIEEATQDPDYLSPVVLVLKSDQKSYRFCVDFRLLTAQTKLHSQQLPTVTEVIETLAEQQPNIMTTLDCRSGFWQVKLHEESRPYTTFTVNGKILWYKKLPMGLKTRSQIFQSLLMKSLRNLNNYRRVFTYVDDLIVLSN